MNYKRLVLLTLLHGVYKVHVTLFSQVRNLSPNFFPNLKFELGLQALEKHIFLSKSLFTDTPSICCQ